MAKSNLDRWLDAFGQLAVLIGLVVVAVELRQTSNIANAEMSGQYLTNWQAIEMAQMDPGFAAVYAKSLERPDELTLPEKVQLDGYYWALMDQLDFSKEMVEVGIFNDSLEDLWGFNARAIMVTPYAQAWWRAFREEFADTARVRIIDAAIEGLSADTYLRRIESIDGHLDDIVRGTPDSH